MDSIQRFAILTLMACEHWITFTAAADGVALLRYEQPADPVPTVIRVTDFGIEPDSGKDAVQGVRAAIQACRKAGRATLVFAKGRYDFHAEHSEQIEYYESNTTDHNPKTCPIVLRQLKGLTIEGNGSEFVFHGRMQPFTLEDCADLTVRNLNLDWDIPFVAQAKIVEVADDHIDIRINKKESPFRIVDGKIVFHGEGWESGWWGCMEFDAVSRIIPQQSGDSPLGGGWNKYQARELDAGLVRLTHDFGRKPKAGNILIMRHSARDHAGVFIYHCQDTVFDNVNLYTAAGLGFLGQFSENITLTNVTVMPHYAKGRYQSGHADGFQVSNCRGHIVVDSCKFEGLMDDPINVHGTSVKIVEMKDRARLVCRFMEGMSTGMTWGRVGETVGFLDHQTMATVGQGVIKAYTRMDKDRFEVEFAASVRDVLIRGNRFHPSCLTSWYQFGEGIISILPIIPQLDPEKPFHRNIRIEGNQFDVFDYSVLYALSVEGLSFTDNTIHHNTQFKPWQGRKAMLTFEACKQVKVSGNKIAADVLGKNVALVKMKLSELSLAPGQGISGPSEPR